MRDDGSFADFFGFGGESELLKFVERSHAVLATLTAHNDRGVISMTEANSSLKVVRAPGRAYAIKCSAINLTNRGHYG